ncbi:hypothetical protein HK096_005786, partial [Nowakowskiella sp. JEL0078]
MSDDKDNLKTPKLEADNFLAWRICFQAHLKGKDLWNIFYIPTTGHFTTSIHFKINDSVFTSSMNHTVQVDFNSSDETMSILRQPLDVGFRILVNSISEAPSIVVQQLVPDDNYSDVEILETKPNHFSRDTRSITPGPDNFVNTTPVVEGTFSSG